MKSLFFYFTEAEEDPRLLQAMEEMLSGTDRAVVIQGAALVDSQLRLAIERKFDGKSYVKAAMEGREFLSSFSARITLARMLGLFDDRLAADLTIIRKLRNEFAHDPLSMDFRTQSVTARCANLTVPDENLFALGDKPDDNRSFMTAEPSELDRANPRFRYVAACAFFTIISASAARYSEPFDFGVANT